MSKNRVVVTGIGLLTPLGFNINENWTNLLNGKSAIKPLISQGKIKISFFQYITLQFFF